jgi:arginyl-tRNA synthetase
MTNTIGESLYRLFTFAGANTKNVTFQGDVGLHIAKALWGIINNKKGIPERLSLYEKQKFLGKCYREGEIAFNSNEHHKREIIKINKNIYSKKNNKQNIVL